MRFDPLEIVCCGIGVLIFYALYHFDVLSGKIIWKIISTEI